VPFHARKERWAVMVAHRRAGKTVACLNDLVKRALECQRPSPRLAYIAPFYAQAKDVAWSYLKQYTEPLAEFGREVNESELRVTLPNGATIRLYGGDNPDALRGIYLDGVVLDEPADMKPRLWSEVVRPALSDRQGWAVFIGTPKGDNDFKAVWDRAEGDKDWFRFMLKASESGLLPQAELDDARRAMGEDRYMQEYECSFSAAIAGAFYAREIDEARSQGRIASLPWLPELPVETAWDIGRSDDTAIWFWQAQRGQVRVIDYYATSGEGAPHYAQVIGAKPYTYRKHWLPHDAFAKTAAAERSFQEQIYSLGVKPVQMVARHAVQDGTQSARALLPRCWFDAEKCKDGLKALTLYQREWDEDRKAFKAHARHDWTSHAADAFRYMAVSLRDDFPALKPTGIDPRLPTLNEIAEDMARRAKQQGSKRI